MPHFNEIADSHALAALLGVDLPPDVSGSTLLNLLRDAPNAEQYLRLRTEVPQLRPGVVMGYLVPKTRIFFNVERSKQLWGDAMVAGAVFSMTQSAPAAFFAASARKLYDNLTLLSDDEAEVVRDFFVLSTGRPYDAPVEEAALRKRFVDTSVPLDAVLDKLERNGIVAKRRGGLLHLVF